MKFSIVLSTQPTTFSALAYQGKLLENIARIKALGFDGIELAVRDPAQIDVMLLTSILKENHLPVSAIGTGQAYVEERLSFADPREEVREKAIERIKAQARLAELFDAIVIIGLVRGKREAELDFETAEHWLVKALRACASDNAGVRFAIEPINRYETNLVNTVRSGIDLLEKVDKKNVGLLLDTFHMNIEESSITESMKLVGDLLFHFHVADSNRWYPGAGHIDFPSVFETLEEIGYTGYVSAEILPFPDSDLAARKTIEYLQRF
jgi:sugar phosphate isomerase/epimerase